MILAPRRGTLTTSSGSAATNIIGKNVFIRHIFIKSATSTTTFDVKLTDIYSNDVFYRNDNTGELNELLELPGFANWTMTIENASADEEFTYLLVAHESC